MNRPPNVRILFVLAVLVCAAVVQAPALEAQDRNIQVVQRTGDERRLALVIGNSSYPVGPLRNPANDARAIAAQLRERGFEVSHVEDGSLREMESAVREFGSSLKRGGTGLFYYAGHGLQVGGENYLVPVDAEIQSEQDVRYEAMAMGRVLGELDEAENGLNIVILDACRNNPFARSWRSADQGLAQVSAPTGTFIAYATAPGSVASDGTGQNGLYTEQLLRFMQVPGLPVEEVFKQVRIAVMERTDGRQIPWESSSLIGSFAFSGDAGAPGVAEPIGEGPSPGEEISIEPTTFEENPVEDLPPPPAAVDAAANPLLAESLAMFSQAALRHAQRERYRPSRRLLHETFSDNAHGWPVGGDPGDRLALENGRYYLSDVDGSRWLRQEAAQGDVLIRADLRYESGFPNAGGGIFFRNSGWDGPRPYVAVDGAAEGGFFFEVGVYDVSRPSGDRWVKLAEWSRSDLLRPGTNTLEMMVGGRSVSIFLNGTYVRTVSNLPTASGEYVGLVVPHSGMEYSFDNLVVVSLVDEDPGREARLLAESRAMFSSEVLRRIGQLGYRPVRRLLHETFTDDSGGWVESAEDGDDVAVRNGRYHLTDGDGSRWIRQPVPQGDVLIRADLRFESGFESNGAGIFFRTSGWKGPRPFVAIDAGPDRGFWYEVGFYDSSRPEDDRWVKWVDWTETDLVRAGNNTIEMIVVGDQVSVYLNGSFVRTVTGIPTTGEFVGVTVLHERMGYSFDDLVVVELEPGS